MPGPAAIAPPSPSIARPEARPRTAELFFSSSGRLGRSPFTAAIAVVLGLLWLYGRWVAGPARAASGWAVLAALLFSGCCLVSRRLHDMGRAGWWSAYPLALLLCAWPAPRGMWGWTCAAMLALLSAWLCAMPGQGRDNGYGASRRGARPVRAAAA